MTLQISHYELKLNLNIKVFLSRTTVLKQSLRTWVFFLVQQYNNNRKIPFYFIKISYNMINYFAIKFSSDRQKPDNTFAHGIIKIPLLLKTLFEEFHYKYSMLKFDFFFLIPILSHLWICFNSRTHNLMGGGKQLLIKMLQLRC